jgi:hypothetical protein
MSDEAARTQTTGNRAWAITIDVLTNVMTAGAILSLLYLATRVVKYAWCNP